MSKEIYTFQEQYPSTESYWRSIILFGRNVASYKFALAKSLMELAEAGKTEVSLEELAVPYAAHICEHIAHSPKQATSSSSRFLDSCEQFNKGEITRQQLWDTTVQLGFNNVIDAFHTVNNAPVQVEFYHKDYARNNKRIILTEYLHKMQELPCYENYNAEVEARWNLVETAWEIGVNRNLLDVKYDDQSAELYVNKDLRRVDVTSARDALNGYQKGKCFYCFDNISVLEGQADSCDVDHFFPHTLQKYIPHVNLNGVWNLVLACKTCNRGTDGKFARVPAPKYLARLHKRNEFLINSHHPLRDTLIRQTGKTAQERFHFLMEIDQIAINLLSHRWETAQAGPEVF